jgi:hypothetical protein
MPIDRARPTGSRNSAARSAARRQAITATAELASTDTICAARNQLAAPARATGTAASKEGKGSQTSNAARGSTNGWVW